MREGGTEGGSRELGEREGEVSDSMTDELTSKSWKVKRNTENYDYDARQSNYRGQVKQKVCANWCNVPRGLERCRLYVRKERDKMLTVEAGSTKKISRGSEEARVKCESHLFLNGFWYFSPF